MPKFVDMWDGGSDAVVSYNGDFMTAGFTMQPCVECSTPTYFYAEHIGRRICSTECHDQHMQGLIDGTRKVNYE